MKQKLQANIEGYLGRPVSLFGVIDTDTGVLTVVKSSLFRQGRKTDCVFINNSHRADCDFAFDETKFKDAITSYYSLKGGMAADEQTPLLMIGSKVGASDPKSAIELDGISDTGMDYRIASDITNLQVAVLAMCLYTHQSVVVDDCINMFDEITKIMQGGIITL